MLIDLVPSGTMVI